MSIHLLYSILILVDYPSNSALERFQVDVRSPFNAAKIDSLLNKRDVEAKAITVEHKSVKDVVTMLQENGFVLKSQKGSHKKPPPLVFTGSVPIPKPPVRRTAHPLEER